MDFLIFNPNLLLEGLPSVNNPFSAMFYIFSSGGWVIFILVIIWGLWTGWLEYIRNKFDTAIKFVLLAIDIPKGNEQSPKAVEHIFSHFYGMLKKGNLKERYIQGYTQMNISLEIVSIEGYIQFLIRAPEKFRDLVEAAVYAQYPEAEITEVEDYVDLIPKPLELPDQEWDIWGSEFKLTKNQLYPIRTYPFFEHSLTQKFMDPIASLLEVMSRMGPGENLWLQILIAPTHAKWREQGEELINKLIGKKNSKKSGIDFLFFPREIGKGLTESITASIVPPSELEGAKYQKQEKEWPSMMQHLSPAEKDVVESVGMKISKIGFTSKIRFIYSAKKDVLNKPKGVEAISGAMQQFSTQNLNSLYIDKKTRTKINYFFIKSRVLGRKRRLLWGYRYRSMKRGRNKYIFNIEELASLWHFPISEVVKVPTVQTVDAKKAFAPTSLPIESATPTIKQSQKESEIKGTPPTNLPTG